MKKLLLFLFGLIALFVIIATLITTNVVEDKGILVQLPPWDESEASIENKKTRNVLSVVVDSLNQVMVRDQLTKVEELTALTKNFINNPEQDSTLAERPDKAIISLKNHRGTNYKIYLEVYNALKSAYNELWEEESLKQFGKSYSSLSNEEKKAIRKVIPLVLSEAEPTNY